MPGIRRSEEHTSELQSPCNLVCRLLLEKKKKQIPSLPTSPAPFPRSPPLHTARCTRSAPCPRRWGTPYHAPLLGVHCCFCFFFNDTATTEIYTLSLHDALPISREVFDKYPEIKIVADPV